MYRKEIAKQTPVQSGGAVAGKEPRDGPIWPRGDLADLEETYRSLFNSIRDAILVVDVNRNITDCNPAFSDLFGYALEEIRGEKTILVYDSRETFEEMERVPREHLEDPGTLHNIRYRTKSGRVFVGETNIFYLQNSMGETVGFVGIIRDINERLRAREQIWRLNRLSAVHASINQAIVRIRDPDRLLAEACRIAVEEGEMRTAWVGLWNEENDGLEVRGRAGHKAGFPVSADVLPRSTVVESGLTSRVFATGQRQLSMDVRTDPRMQMWRDEAVAHDYLSCAVFPLVVLDEIRGVFNLYSGEPNYFDCEELQLLDELARDISFALEVMEREEARCAAERQRRQTAAWLQSLIEASPLAIIELDGQGLVRYWNRAAGQIFGWSANEVLGKPPPYVPPEKWDEFCGYFSRVMDGEDLRGVELVRRTKDGREVLTSLSTAPVYSEDGDIAGVMSVIEDVTEQKREQEKRRQTEAELVRAEKMGAVGRLAGGVAHDFNNMLNVILGNTELALEKSKAEGYSDTELREIQDAARRSAGLARQLLSFTRSQSTEPKIFDLNRAINDRLEMLGRLIGESVEIKFFPGGDSTHVRMDPSRLDQILVNLAANARDAISGTGEITIETVRLTLDRESAQQHPDAGPGEYIVLAFSDTGSGMDADTLEKVFEPFFTTKQEGTGFGLSTVYGAVGQAGGVTHAYSEMGGGTTIEIRLPVADAQEDMSEQQESGASLVGTETVLVAEDEVQILRLVERALVKHGYSVLAAGSPEDALELAGENPGELDLLVTDVVMPGMSGSELNDRMRSIIPGLETLYMSGYTADAMSDEGMPLGHLHFIGKPFSTDELLRKVRYVLDARRV